MIQENGREIRMNFGFSLYAVSLLAILVIYLRMRLGDLADEESLENNKMCCYQYWR